MGGGETIHDDWEPVSHQPHPNKTPFLLQFYPRSPCFDLFHVCLVLRGSSLQLAQPFSSASLASSGGGKTGAGLLHALLHLFSAGQCIIYVFISNYYYYCLHAACIVVILTKRGNICKALHAVLVLMRGDGVHASLHVNKSGLHCTPQPHLAQFIRFNLFRIMSVVLNVFS